MNARRTNAARLVGRARASTIVRGGVVDAAETGLALHRRAPLDAIGRAGPCRARTVNRHALDFTGNRTACAVVGVASVVLAPVLAGGGRCKGTSIVGARLDLVRAGTLGLARIAHVAVAVQRARRHEAMVRVPARAAGLDELPSGTALLQVSAAAAVRVGYANVALRSFRVTDRSRTGDDIVPLVPASGAGLQHLGVAGRALVGTRRTDGRQAPGVGVRRHAEGGRNARSLCGFPCQRAVRPHAALHGNARLTLERRARTVVGAHLVFGVAQPALRTRLQHLPANQRAGARKQLIAHTVNEPALGAAEDCSGLRPRRTARR